MSESHRISQQMRQAVHGNAWHGPALIQILNDVNVTVAAARPIASAHTIWEIVLHIIATQTLSLRRLRGDVRALTPDEDWPPMPEPTEAAWRETIEAFTNGEEQLRFAVESFPETQLNESMVSEGTSAYNNFHGHVQHNLYHAGQISLLKKMAASK